MVGGGGGGGGAKFVPPTIQTSVNFRSFVKLYPCSLLTILRYSFQRCRRLKKTVEGLEKIRISSISKIIILYGSKLTFFALSLRSAFCQQDSTICYEI